MSTQTTPITRSAGAERMRRHRERRLKGMRCLTIELLEKEIDILIRRGRLAPGGRDKPGAIKKALYDFFDDMLR